jgi:hypothetical protein
MRAMRIMSIVLAAALGPSGCADINWQATYDDWARSVCREDGVACEEQW